MALSNDQFGELTRLSKTLTTEAEALRLKIVSMGRILAEVGYSLQDPDTFSYHNCHYDGVHGRPDAKLRHDYPTLTTTVEESGKLLADYRTKLREIKNVQSRLDNEQY